jgi:hypothetical protein
MMHLMGWRKMLETRSAPVVREEYEGWLATAATYAHELTETGARCHFNDSQRTFCLWEAMELDGQDPSGDPTPMVGVRCTVHDGGRCLDADARPDLADFA